MPPTGRLPQLGVAGLSDARGLSQLDRALLSHNPRRGILDRRKGEEPATTLLRGHGTQSTTLRKESKSSKFSLMSRV